MARTINPRLAFLRGKMGLRRCGDAAAGQIQSTYPRGTYDRNFIKRGGERKELCSRQRFQRDNSRDFHPLLPSLSSFLSTVSLIELSKVFYLRGLFDVELPFRSVSLRELPFFTKVAYRSNFIRWSNYECRRSSSRPFSLSLFLYPRYPRVPCKIHSPFITIMTLRSLCSPAESFMPSRGTTFVECSSATVRLTCISRGNLPSLKRTEVAFHGSFEIPASSSRSGLLSFFHLCFHSVLVETGRKTRPCKV